MNILANENPLLEVEKTVTCPVFQIGTAKRQSACRMWYN